MDAFYAAIEQRDNPDLRGKPILVGGSGKRGVVTTASYEARPFGCRSAMPTGQALRLCPHAIVVPIRMEVYAQASRQVRAVLERFSPDIEPVSIDEAFVDLTHVPAWSARAEQAAHEIKRSIKTELRVTASVGVAPNKFLAKVASDMNKPDGLGVIAPEDAAAMLAPMSVSVIWGVGRVATENLRRFGIRTVGELLAFDERELARHFGSAAAHWRSLALGQDAREIHTERTSKSIGKERTFSDDIGEPARLRAILMDETEQAARLLREDGLFCRRVALKLRRPDFQTYSRSSVLETPTDRTDALWRAADHLFSEFLRVSPGPLRLIGVRLEDLHEPTQPGLFDAQPAEERKERVDAVTDAIAAKFGRAAISRAGSLGARKNRPTGNAGRNPQESR
jgi:DNA polymerase-4